MQVNDVIPIPTTAFVWVGGLILGFLGLMLSGCMHLLITMNTNLNKFITSQSVHNAQIELRLDAVEKKQIRVENRSN